MVNSRNLPGKTVYKRTSSVEATRLGNQVLADIKARQRREAELTIDDTLEGVEKALRAKRILDLERASQPVPESHNVLDWDVYLATQGLPNIDSIDGRVFSQANTVMLRRDVASIFDSVEE